MSSNLEIEYGRTKNAVEVARRIRFGGVGVAGVALVASFFTTGPVAITAGVVAGVSALVAFIAHKIGQEKRPKFSKLMSRMDDEVW